MEAPRLRKARTGFSLIELLIVVTIVGLLATLGYARYSSLSKNANLAVLKGDMRSVMLHQALYQRERMLYGSLEDLEVPLSEGVTVDLTWLDAGRGYAVTGTHVNLPETVCGAFLGDAPAGVAEPAEEEGEVVCADGS